MNSKDTFQHYLEKVTGKSVSLILTDNSTEMLHSAVRDLRKNNRRSVYTSEFRKRQRLFRDYDKAIGWEKRNR